MSRDNDEFKSNFGGRLKVARKEMGLNQTDFAEKIGVARDTLSRYERGELAPSIEVLSSIVSVLGPNMKADWLLFGFPTEIEKHPLRIPTFGLVTALHFDGAGTADVLMDLSDIRKVLEALAVLETQRDGYDPSIIDAINRLNEHFTELEYSDDEEFTVSMIAEAMIAVHGVQFTPLATLGIRGSRQNQLTPEQRISARKSGKTKVKQSIKGKENQVAGRDIVFKKEK